MGLSTFTSNRTAPFVFDDNWDNFGNRRPQSRRSSAANADGVPVVPLAEEQKFTFDTHGRLRIPGVIDAAELDKMRALCYGSKIGRSRCRSTSAPRSRVRSGSCSITRRWSIYGEAANTGRETRNRLQRVLG